MVKRLVLSALALLLVGAAYVVFRMGPRNIIGMIRYDQREEGKLRVGDRAPDVELVALDGATRVKLSDHLETRPTIIIFGSFT